MSDTESGEGTLDDTVASSAIETSRADDEPLLSARNLKKHFDRSDGLLDRLFGGASSIKAVDGVNLDLYPGQTLAVVGESGCGKSTLGRTLLNLDTPTAGRIEYRGTDLAGLSDGEMRPYRQTLQMVFQDPLASLNPRQTVGQIVTAPMEVHGIGENDADRAERARDLLERVGLKPGHFDRYPQQFSGGQQQRVGIARALALEPELIVADEPVSALDVSVQAQILSLLEEIRADLDVAVLFITHDLSVVRQIADQVAVMYLGEIVETALVDELFANPRHPYTKSLLSAVPRINPDARTERTILNGTVPSPADPPSGCRFHTRCPAVIPPQDWSGSQREFKTAFNFRTRVVAGEISPEAIRTRLKAKSKNVSDATVAARIADRVVPDDCSLPADATETIKQAAIHLTEGDADAAEHILIEAFPSPCERDTPEAVPSKGGYAACHRVNPEAPGMVLEEH